MNDSTLPGQIHLNFLSAVRMLELRQAVKHFPPAQALSGKCQLMELGAGTGAQAKALSDLGYAVAALDVRSSSYRAIRCFDVIEYDGVTIPLSSSSQDVVFSSNVLEHVVDIDAVLKETYRVLKSDGVCIHIVPTPLCRIWSLAAHYVWFGRRVLRRFFPVDSRSGSPDLPRTPATFDGWLWTVFPPRHGERGNTVTEIYYYSCRFWVEKFKSNGFDVLKHESNNVFYTMANSLGGGVSIRARQRLARFLGGACRVYVLRKGTIADER